ncbi:MAG: hypothetical protein KC613_25670 [Myxococcales bacterium]|nr:hypothetical protein [Myxococcales bacterium]MCB9526349.1 hypothetical protein [Myxococcales bacterium]
MRGWLRGVLTGVITLAVLLALPAPATADLRLLTAARWRINRPGLGFFNDLGWRRGLYPKNDSLILQGCFVEGGLVAQVSPASLHPGVYVQAVPVAPILLRASIQRLEFFGNFGMLMTFDSPQADWSPPELHERQQKDGQLSGGWYGELRAQLRLKVKRVVTLHEQRVGWFRADLDVVGADQGWYEPINDLLMAQTDWLHTMKTTVGALAFGDLNHEFLVVALHWERYKVREAGTLRHIAGLVGLGRPRMDWWGAPSFGLLLGLMPVDDHRAGYPYVGGFANFSFSLAGDP